MSMMQMLLGTAAAALNVDNVFDIATYAGDSSTSRSIDNGMDLSGEGGLLWIKKRSSSGSNVLVSSVKAVTSNLFSDSTSAAVSVGDLVTSLNSNGWTMDDNSLANSSGENYVAWTFLKSSNFFDVVSYTGNATAGRTVSHSLGTEPGMIFLKRTDAVSGWRVYHTGLGNTKYVELNTVNTNVDSDAIWNDTSPTSTEFTIGDDASVNANAGTYEAYLFAKDNSIIKCDSYTGNSTTSNPITVGFQPQLVMIRSTTGGPWYVFDTARGVGTASNADKVLQWHSTNGEVSTSLLNFTSTGFTLESTDTSVNSSAQTYLYMAIAAS